MQLRSYPRIPKSIKQLFSLKRHENSTLFASRHRYSTLRTVVAALVCFALFALIRLLPLPLLLIGLLQFVTFASFVVLLIRIGQQMASGQPSSASTHPHLPVYHALHNANAVLTAKVDALTAALRLANEGLVAREAKRQQLIVNLPAPVMISRQAHILLMNDACQRLTNWPIDEAATGRAVTAWLALGPFSDEQQLTVVQHLAAMAQGTQSAPVELLYNDTDAQPRVLGVQSTRIEFDGEPAVLTMFLAQRGHTAAAPCLLDQPIPDGIHAFDLQDDYAFLFHRPLAEVVNCSTKSVPRLEQHGGLKLFHPDDKRRPRSEQPATRQPEHFQQLVEQSPAIIYRGVWDNGPKLHYIAPNVRQVLGYTCQELLQHPTFAAAQCHPDDVARLWHAIETSLPTGAGQAEYRMRHQDGTYRWLLSEWRGLPDSNQYVGHLLDITARKQMEKELTRSRIEIRKLATRLNTVHEEERARMAREVHDVLGQNLTVLKFGLEHITTDLPIDPAADPALDPVVDPAEVKRQLTTKVNKLIAVVDQTVEHVQRLSAQLRPCTLDELGLTPAIEWLVCEFTWQSEFTVELDLPDQPAPMEADLALVLYRIVQEALTNIVRHAKATQVKIALQVTPDKALLLIQDNGAGFNPNQPRTKKSMGLMGMHERMAPWDATVRIDSTIGQGTTISVEVLLSPP